MDQAAGDEISEVHFEILKDEANFIQNVSQFFNTEALSDVTLRVDDQTFYGHKFVLAKSSDVFRTMLYEREWHTDGTNELVLSETADCKPVFDRFLRYLYTAEVEMSPDSAIGILCLADKYNVDSLKSLCVQFMVENSRSPKVDNAMAWYSWGKALHIESLQEQCTKTIAWNYNNIISSSVWLNMEADFIEDLMKSSELIVQNEYCLWEAVKMWLCHENHSPQLKTFGHKLLPLLRFPQMLVSQLYQVEQSELSSMSEVKDLIHELLSRAYRFRSLCPEQQNLDVTFSKPFYLPRDYIDLTVDNVRMQNTLRFGIQVDVKMYRGPVPSDNRTGDWKITYRKQQETWLLQLYSHESAMVSSEARVQCSVIIHNDQEKVVQVHREPTTICSRGNNVTIQISVNQPVNARSMSVLIKPIPS